jgi:hypothetical protein
MPGIVLQELRLVNSCGHKRIAKCHSLSAMRENDGVGGRGRCHLQFAAALTSAAMACATRKGVISVALTVPACAWARLARFRVAPLPSPNAVRCVATVAAAISARPTSVVPASSNPPGASVPRMIHPVSRAFRTARIYGAGILRIDQPEDLTRCASP